jgi:hypothetical protein
MNSKNTVSVTAQAYLRNPVAGSSKRGKVEMGLRGLSLRIAGGPESYAGSLRITTSNLMLGIVPQSLSVNRNRTAIDFLSSRYRLGFVQESQ